MEQAGYQFLFEKQLFTSDTGTLCRLIIPKHFAKDMLKFYTAEEIIQVKDSLNGEGLSVRIYDLEDGIEETFVLKYWKSSDSYVFIHGWIIFVRRRALKACDTIKFWRDHANSRLCITCSSSGQQDARAVDQEDSATPARSLPPRIHVDGRGADYAYQNDGADQEGGADYPAPAPPRLHVDGPDADQGNDAAASFACCCPSVCTCLRL